MGNMMTSEKKCDWKSILNEIYQPPIGSLWVLPNNVWNNSFAHNKRNDGIHPSVVGRVFPSDHKCWIIPGTSKDYIKGTGVFKTKINPSDPNCPISYFLIKLRMTYNSKDLSNFQYGWNGIDSLSDNQVKDLKLQIKFYLGIDV